MSRPRKQGNSSLPDNLYRKHDLRTGKTYYAYRNPQSGKLHGLGTDQEAAVNDARALNAAIYTSIRSACLSAIVAPKSESVTVEKVIERHLELSSIRGLAKNTLRLKTGNCNHLKAALGAVKPIGDVTVRDIVDFLDKYDDRPRMRQSMRSEAVDLWKTALQEGWATDNVADKTRTSTAKVKRSRLTLDDFRKIHASALTLPNKWIARSLELALVTAQRVSDVGAMEFRQIKASTSWIDGNALCVMQIKSQGKTKIRIPLEVGVNGWTIGSVIKSCKDNIITRWIIHHSIHHGGAKPGRKISLGALSRGFAEARDLAGVTGDSKTPPTFHEIRSLSIRLYAEKYGKDFAQAIAGHKDAAMTAIYQDTRGSEWMQVKAG